MPRNNNNRQDDMPSITLYATQAFFFVELIAVEHCPVDTERTQK
jgi:hypothetical protein